MFDRVEYKRIAKKQLKGRWKTPILATLCTIVLLLIINAPEILNSWTESGGASVSFTYGTSVEGISGIIMLGISGILALAYTKLFIELWKTRDALPFSTFLAGFSHWLKGVLGIFWLYLWVFLWSLLFFIPGFVKAYAYSQMFFIIAENPKISVRRAMKLSIEITRGYKGDLFVMDLSFIGWILLSCLTGGLLNLYVMPYMQMSKTNAYKMLKAMAIRSGRVSDSDFGEGAFGADEEQDAGFDSDTQGAYNQHDASGQSAANAPGDNQRDAFNQQAAYHQQNNWDTAGAEDVTAYETPHPADSTAPSEPYSIPPADVINLPPPEGDEGIDEI